MLESESGIWTLRIRIRKLESGFGIWNPDSEVGNRIWKLESGFGSWNPDLEVGIRIPNLRNLRIRIFRFGTTESGFSGSEPLNPDVELRILHAVGFRFTYRLLANTYVLKILHAVGFRLFLPGVGELLCLHGKDRLKSWLKLHKISAHPLHRSCNPMCLCRMSRRRRRRRMSWDG